MKEEAAQPVAEKGKAAPPLTPESVAENNPIFQAVPGAPAGSAVYNEMRVATIEECSGFCQSDDDCSAYEYDSNFGMCKLMKTDMKKLERQAAKVETKAVKQEAENVEKQAGAIEKKEEKEEKKEEEDKAKVAAEPMAELVKKSTPRDDYRKAIRKEKEMKTVLKDRSVAHKEVKEKVLGTATVERIAKRNQKDITEDFNEEHKAFSAAVMNLEEQVMIRDDRNSKEVVLAKGAKEEAEVKYDKIHVKLLNAGRMEKKALDMNAREVKAEINAAQAVVKSKLAAKKALVALKKATKAYKAEEIKNKNAEDLLKRQQAAQAKTYLKLRSMVKERDARAASASVTDFKDADKKAQEDCEAQQSQVRETEMKLKQEFTERLGAKERAEADKAIKRLKDANEKKTAEKDSANEKKLVKAAKKKADAQANVVESTMTTDELGEVKSAQESSAAAEKASAKAALEKSHAAVAKLEQTMSAAEEQEKKATDDLKALEAELEAKSDDEDLAIKVEKAKETQAKDSKLVEAASKELTSAKLEESEAEAGVSKANADSKDAKVGAKLKKTLELKAINEAEQKATIDAASNAEETMKEDSAAAQQIRDASNQRIAALVEVAWRKKKAELGLKVVNCLKPHLSPVEKLKQRVEELESEKLAASAVPPPISAVDPAVAKQIEDRVRAAEQMKMKQELAETKREMKEKMKEQLRREKKIMNKENSKLTKKTKEAEKAEAKAKSAAALSKKSAAKAKKRANGDTKLHELSLIHI
eukprot:TRINITY_DN483_c0_g3_i2.p1 TRINITY_DN483_c0_g3~~TRINITY_DN483_c0_g3_i2.p1  ORF type:complete len:759 (-),score=408.68 TRINITY_DN483_c0_g3_i2:177-2453(-)